MSFILQIKPTQLWRMSDGEPSGAYYLADKYDEAEQQIVLKPDYIACVN